MGRLWGRFEMVSEVREGDGDGDGAMPVLLWCCG